MTDLQDENWHGKNVQKGELVKRLKVIQSQIQVIADEYAIEKGISIEITGGTALCIIDLDSLTIG